jgi:hypothetical protein
MNSFFEFFISLGDDSVFIKDVSLAFLMFSFIPFMLSLFKVKIVKILKIYSLESFWIILFLTNLIQLFISHFFILTNLSYCVVSLSIALIVILLIKGKLYEN